MEPIIGPMIEYMEAQKYPIGIVLVEHRDYRLTILDEFASFEEILGSLLYSDTQKFIEDGEENDQAVIDQLNEKWKEIISEMTPKKLQHHIQTKSLSNLFDKLNLFLKRNKYSYLFKVFYGNQSLETVENINDTFRKIRKCNRVVY